MQRFADMLRSRACPFVLCLLVAFAASLLPAAEEHRAPLIAAAVLAVAVVALSWTAAARRVPVLVPLGMLAVVVLLAQSRGGGADSGFGPLFVLPVLWSALFLDRRQAVALALCVSATILLFAAFDDIPSEQIRRALIWTMVAHVLALFVSMLVAMLRQAREAADLATADTQAALNQLEIATERHRLTLTQLPESVISVYDRDRRCLSIEGLPLGLQDAVDSRYIGRLMEELVPAEEADEIRRHAALALAGEQISTERVKPDGRIVASALGPYRGRTGEIEGIVAISRDVTAQRRRAHALEIERTFTDAILARLSDHVVVVDSAGRVLDLQGGSLADQAATGSGEPLSTWCARHGVARPGEATAMPFEQVPLERALAGEHVRDVPITLLVAGQRRTVVVTASPITTADDVRLGAVAAVTDITERVRLEERLRHTADHDGLTGLPNRGRMELEMERHLRAHDDGAVMLVDVDRFKLVNDTLGHAAGDEVLMDVAETLGDIVGEHGVVARLGGDELAVLLSHADRVTAEATARAMVERVRAQMADAAPGLRISISVGVALNEPGARREELMRRADLALYEAKAAGRDGFRVFRPDEHLLLGRVQDPV